MWTLFIKTLKDRRVSTIIYCAAAVLLVLMYIAMYPSILKQTETLSEVLKNYPQGFMKAFGVESLDFSHVENFLSMEQFGIVWPIMTIFLVAGFASHVLAKEIEQGTAEILLSRPVSRLKIYFSRHLAAVVVLLVFTLLSVLCVPPLASAFNIDYVLSHYFTTALMGFLFGLAFFSIAIMFSAFFSEKSRVAMSVGSVAIVMYVAKIISSLLDRFDWAKYVSFFYYFDPNATLIRGELNTLPIIVFVGCAIVCTAIGAWRFNKRDIAV
ncbi:MAG: ABC transporter permease subunit [Patescibacteria group bacterium]|jgi:ABC-2 type transport system permease protein